MTDQKMWQVFDETIAKHAEVVIGLRDRAAG